MADESPRDRAAYYRQQAAIHRGQAVEMGNAETAALMLNVAQAWHRLATLEEWNVFLPPLPRADSEKDKPI